MAISIGTVATMKTPDDWAVIPDDRQTLVQTLDGVVAVDAGRVETGDRYAFTGTFTPTAWAILKGYWNNRTFVPVVMPNGETLANCRVVVKGYTFADPLFKNYIKAQIEIWEV